jgi:toxin secretion/phage lysis holin
MRENLHAVVVVLGTGVTTFLGGADTVLKALAVLMVLDYVSGIVVAMVFHNSPKSNTGGLNSSIGFKGIFKKLFMVAMVGVANVLDTVLGTDFVRTGLVFSLITNEAISIVENAGCMGIEMPPAITKAIDILKQKENPNV